MSLDLHRTSTVRATTIVAAHPDDELVGAASVLIRQGRDLAIVHVTDGSPRNLDDARRAGFESRDAYTRARRAELLAAFDLAGLDPSACRDLAFVDQEAVFNLEAVVRQLLALLLDLSPRRVITHAYEGGHPDHDATALAVHAAVALLRRQRDRAPAVFEMTSYHAGPTGIETGTFLGSSAAAATVHLDAWERGLKAAMLRCCATQRATLAPFTAGPERFRPAPCYCFARPPHKGRLFYEHFDWGVDGPAWRARATRALTRLGLDPATCL